MKVMQVNLDAAGNKMYLAKIGLTVQLFESQVGSRWMIKLDSFPSKEVGVVFNQQNCRVKTPEFEVMYTGDGTGSAADDAVSVLLDSFDVDGDGVYAAGDFVELPVDDCKGDTKATLASSKSTVSQPEPPFNSSDLDLQSLCSDFGSSASQLATHEPCLTLSSASSDYGASHVVHQRWQGKGARSSRPVRLPTPDERSSGQPACDMDNVHGLRAEDIVPELQQCQEGLDDSGVRGSIVMGVAVSRQCSGGVPGQPGHRWFRQVPRTSLPTNPSEGSGLLPVGDENGRPRDREDSQAAEALRSMASGTHEQGSPPSSTARLRGGRKRTRRHGQGQGQERQGQGQGQRQAFADQARSELSRDSPAARGAHEEVQREDREGEAGHGERSERGVHRDLLRLGERSWRHQRCRMETSRASPSDDRRCDVVVPAEGREDAALSLSVSTVPSGTVKFLRGAWSASKHPFIEAARITHTASMSEELIGDSDVSTWLAQYYDHVGEVFSVPRVVTVAAKEGLRATVSIDLLNGFDLLTSGGRETAWWRLQKSKPLLLVISPPCRMFSLMQNMNPEFMSSPQGIALMKEAIALANFCVFLLYCVVCCLFACVFVIQNPSPKK
jgi:hypothetical protein